MSVIVVNPDWGEAGTDSPGGNPPEGEMHAGVQGIGCALGGGINIERGVFSQVYLLQGNDPGARKGPGEVSLSR